MKKILLPVFILALSSVHAQQKITIVKFERANIKSPAFPKYKVWQNFIILSTNDTLFEGTILKLGKGTLPNGDYNFIATASNTMQAKLKRSTTLTEVKIIELNRKGNEKYGYKYFIKTEGGYLVQLEDAVVTGEIIYNDSLSKK